MVEPRRVGLAGMSLSKVYFWDQQVGEKNLEFQKFQLYMKHDGNLRKSYQAFRIAQGHENEPLRRYEKIPGPWRDLSRKREWKKRLNAHELWIRAGQNEEDQEVLDDKNTREMIKRGIKLAQTAQISTLQMYLQFQAEFIRRMTEDPLFLAKLSTEKFLSNMIRLMGVRTMDISLNNVNETINFLRTEVNVTSDAVPAEALAKLVASLSEMPGSDKIMREADERLKVIVDEADSANVGS